MRPDAAPDARGRTQLHLAVENDDCRAVDALLGRGACRDAVDARGYTPFALAEALGHVACADLLRADLGDVCLSLEIALDATVNDRDHRAVRAFLDRGALLSGGRDRDPPLVRAARLGALACAREIVLHDESAVWLHSHVNGWLPLHAACSRGHAQIVRMLLHKGASPCSFAEDGQTPLDIARAFGHEDCLRMLERPTDQAGPEQALPQGSGTSVEAGQGEPTWRRDRALLHRPRAHRPRPARRLHGGSAGGPRLEQDVDAEGAQVGGDAVACVG